MKSTRSWTKSLLAFLLIAVLGVGIVGLKDCFSQEEPNTSSINDDSEQSAVSKDDEPTPKIYTEFPFDADEAVRRQEETAEVLGVPVEYENEIGMKFRLIPAGEFLMGSPEDEEGRLNDESLHQVQITKPYYMGVCEVTQGEWEEVMDFSLRDFTDAVADYYGEGTRHHVYGEGAGHPMYGEGADYPMYNASWYGTIEFCNKLSESEGKSPYYELTNILLNVPYIKGMLSIRSATVSILGGDGYRLPTEAEWEYTCRAGSEEAYYGELDEISWYHKSDGETNPVGSKLPNSFGVYDMTGNVWEWCEDWYSEDYYGVSPTDDPTGPSTGEYRAIRGGGWLSSPRFCRSAFRYRYPASIDLGSLLGFRVVFSVEPSE
jgi:formylglycine-generating enzyme required for sulfatase activity